MPKVILEEAHSLGKVEATARLDQFSDQIAAKYSTELTDISQEWHGDRLAFGFKAMGMKIQGDVEVREEAVSVVAKLPLAAMVFRGKIEATIREELKSLLL